MVPRISIVANACHLPGYFHAGFAARYFKMISGHLLRDIEIGCWCADSGKLVTEILIQGAEIIWQGHHRLTLFIQGHGAVIDVLHVGRLNKGVVEVFVRRISGVIDLEGAATLSEIAIYLNIAAEQTGDGISGCRSGINSNTPARYDPIQPGFAEHADTVRHAVHSGPVG